MAGGEDQCQAGMGDDRVSASSSLSCLLAHGMLTVDRATCSILGWDPTEMSYSASVGEPNANCEAKIMADDGAEILERNKRGELWVRAKNIMKGYWRNPKATQETKTADGWLKTGDIAYVDDAGHFHVVDRMKVYPQFYPPSGSSASLTRIGIDQSQGQPSRPRGTGSIAPRTPGDCRRGGDWSRDVCLILFFFSL